MKHISLLRKPLLFALLLVSLQAFSQSLSPLVIGTIHARDSVVIYYDVTINTGAGSSVTNQGTVSGSNFSAFTTDDPDSGPSGDATITLLNMFPLPVNLLQVSASRTAGGVQVAWSVNSEENMIRYEVEKSTDGRSFARIGEVQALNSMSERSYTFLDATPSGRVNYYRLRMVEQSGSGKYSFVVKVDLSGAGSGVKIYPNPVVQGQLTLQLSNVEKGAYELVLYNSLGQLAYRQTIAHTGGSVSRSVSLPPGLLKGVYRVQLKSDRTLLSQSLIVQ